MKNSRVVRINSLLREVVSEVIRGDYLHESISLMTTITKVEMNVDLHHAKVYVSVIGNDEERKKVIDALERQAKTIRFYASKQVRMRYFPELHFILDHSVDDQMKINEVLKEIHEKDHDEHS
jgi:ribosome-binding factor A